MNKFEILSSLLKSHFDSQLTTLEKNSKLHLSLISTSITLAKGVSSLCISIAKRIKEKPATKQRRATTPVKSSFNPKYNVSKTRPKTPGRSLTLSKSMSKLQKTPQRERKLMTSKSNASLLRSKIKTPTRTISKTKSTMNLLHNKSTNGSSTNTSRISKTIPSKNRTAASSTSVSRQYKQQKKIGTSKSHSNFNTYQKNESKSSTNIKPIRKKTPLPNKTLDDDSISKILSMESNIQNDFLLNHEDPLLINPITDIDFIHNDLMIKLDIDGVNHIRHFNVEEFAEDHLNILTKFLNKKDICNLMMCNKLLSRLIKSQFLSNLEEEKKKYEDKLLEYKQDEIPPEDSSPFKTKKNTLKALDLLNGQVLNKPFKESTKVPSNDVIRIYYIYFQLINNTKIINSIWNKEEFWKLCCDYFMVENKGKIGDLVIKNINENLILTIENMYLIIHIIGDNLTKIFPGYFSTICGTTGLFAFVIKDVLDYFGLSTDKEIQKKSYWTYKKMIIVIEDKIQRIKNLIK